VAADPSVPAESPEGRGRRARLAGLVAGPLAFALILAWPAPGLSWPAHALAAVFAWTVLYWMTEALPVPVTALLSSVLAIGLGIAPARSVLAAYADPIVFLFLGSFMLAQAMQSSGLHRRFAVAVLRWDWATRTPARVMGAVGGITCAISLWVSNTATTAIMLPVGLGVLGALGPAGDHARSRFPVGFLLMLTWASSVAVGIPIASPPNLIAIAMLRELGGRRLTFLDWVAVTMPLTVVMLVLCWAILHLRYGTAGAASGRIHAYVAAERARLGPWSRAERNVAVAFGLAATLWLAPGALALLSAPEAPLPRLLEARLPESVVALGAAILLFVLPTDFRGGEFTLSWRDAVRIDWGTILLFGGGLAMGRLLFETGLAESVGRGLVAAVGAESPWALTAVAIVAGVALSESSSNTAAASALVPLIIAVATGAGLSPVPPVLGAALGASFGFMLPVSTPPNAIVYGSGLVPLREMIVSGIWLDLAGAVVIWLGLRILCPLFGVL
jgi:sodium-dependent dicarboxylate transporter 2/3/5